MLGPRPSFGSPWPRPTPPSRCDVPPRRIEWVVMPEDCYLFRLLAVMPRGVIGSPQVFGT
jgi:hypothetical protein